MSRPSSRELALGASALAAAGTGAWLASRARRAARSGPYAGPRLPPSRAVEVKSADGTRIHTEEFGNPDGPPLVLLHAWMCSLELWHRQITALAPEARIVAYDLRGHGGSGFSEELDYSIEAFADDLEAVLDAHLSDGERAVLCGNSLGAMTIAAWAHRHPGSVPKRAAAVAMLATGMGDLTSQALVVRGPSRLNGARQRLSEALLCTEIPFDSAPDSVIRATTHYIALGPDARPEDVALVARMARDCPRVVRGRCGGTLSQLDVFDGLANLDVPALVVAGRADKMTPPAHAHRLAELLPTRPEVIEVPRAGHMLPLEADELVNARLRELLAEAAAARRGRRAPAAAA